MTGRVIHICQRKPGDLSIYIGRRGNGFHYGNPFSHRPSDIAAVKVGSLAEALTCCAAWLDGTAHQDVEPERREWVLEHLPKLKGRKLACFCAPQDAPEGVGVDDPICCHGQLYLKMLETQERSSGEYQRKERIREAIAPWTATRQKQNAQPKIIQPSLF